MFTSGQLLVDRYRLTRRIAVGGMGEVWEAADTRLDRKIAIKVLKPELCGDAEFLHRFRIEARMTASLNHPGIAAVHDYGETAAIPGGPEDTAYLVMELVEGDPLAGILARERYLSPERTLDVLEQAGHALQSAHERALVHRDVKPGNILVTPAGQVKITDFGIAKAADAAPVTRSGMVMGTAHYIAPEQAIGQDAEPASDVYSLAVVGFECLVGHRPFLSDNAVTVAMMHIRNTPPPLPPHVPPGVRALIEATLVKDPRRRYQTGGEFACAVAAVRAGRPLPVPSSLLAGAKLGPGTGVGLPVVAPTRPHPGNHPGSHPGTQPGINPVPPPGTHPGMHPVPQQRPPMNSPVSAFPSQQPPPIAAHNNRNAWLALGAALLVILAVVALITVLAQSALPAGSGPARPAGNPAAAAIRSPIGPPGSSATDLTYHGLSGRARHHELVSPVSFAAQPGVAGINRVRRIQPEDQLSQQEGIDQQASDPSHCMVNEVTPSSEIKMGSRVILRCKSRIDG